MTIRADAAVTIPVPREALLPWLVEPERLCTWVVGLHSVTPVGDQFGVELGATGAVYGRGTHLEAELLEASPGRVVRRYRLPSSSDYSRTVTYVLTSRGAGTRIECVAETVIRGLSRSVAGPAQRREAASMAASLERLDAVVTGSPRSLWARWLDRRRVAVAL